MMRKQTFNSQKKDGMQWIFDHITSNKPYLGFHCDHKEADKLYSSVSEAVNTALQ